MKYNIKNLKCIMLILLVLIIALISTLSVSALNLLSNPLIDKAKTSENIIYETVTIGNDDIAVRFRGNFSGEYLEIHYLEEVYNLVYSTEEDGQFEYIYVFSEQDLSSVSFMFKYDGNISSTAKRIIKAHESTIIDKIFIEENISEIKDEVVEQEEIVVNDLILEEVINELNTSVRIINESLIRSQIVIGEPVKWVKQIIVEGEGDINIELPKQAQNIAVKTKEEARLAVLNIREEKAKGLGKEVVSNRITGHVVKINNNNFLIRFFRWLSGGVTGKVIYEEEFLILDISNVVSEEEIAIEYYTEAPQASEELIENGKRVVVSGPSDLGYTDILAYTILEEGMRVSFNEKAKIRMYWYVDSGTEKVEISFDAFDLSDDGFVDYIEWIVPHLSEQTFEIIIMEGDLCDGTPENVNCWSAQAPSTLAWSTEYIVTGAQSNTDGQANTDNLVAQSGSYPAAEYCATLDDGVNPVGTWYLPAKDELWAGWGALGSGTFTSDGYWSSTQDSDIPGGDAWLLFANFGGIYGNGKGGAESVRCLRDAVVADPSYIITNLSGNLGIFRKNDSTNLSEVGQSGVVASVLKKQEIFVAEMDINFSSDIDFSGVVADSGNLSLGSDYGISVVHIPSELNSVVSNVVLKIPEVAGTGRVFVCPDATSLTDVNLSCPNIYSETVVAVDGFYNISVSGTGGGELPEGTDLCDGTPENADCWSAQAPSDLVWSTEYIVTGAQSDTDGQANTDNLVAQSGSYPAAEYCATLDDGVNPVGTWYLPAKDELWAGWGALGSGGFPSDWYWSSTEHSGYPESDAWNLLTVYFMINNGKGNQDSVRCLRDAVGQELFAGGDGTSGNPYQITSWTHLNNTRLNLSASYVLNNNLTADDADYGGLGDDWEPIGDSSINFQGTFDGNGYTISGLNIHRPLSERVGLFGEISGSISNLSLVVGNITANRFSGGAGAFTGLNSGTISNCSVVVEGVVLGYSTGGIVGDSDSNTIINSHAIIKGTVSGSYTGGLSGWGGTITNSHVIVYDTATIYSDGMGYGLIVNPAYGTVTNSYGVIYDSNHGNITFFEDVGHLSGNLTDSMYLDNNLAYVNGSVSGFNKSARIYLKDTGITG
jgi:hypothetical protein